MRIFTRHSVRKNKKIMQKKQEREEKSKQRESRSTQTKVQRLKNQQEKELPTE